MKRFLALLLLFGSPALAQEAPQPFKGANLVLVHTPDSARAALRLVALQLQRQGFAVNPINYELLSVTTAAKAVPKAPLNTMTATASVEAGAVVLRGQWHAQLNGMSMDEAAAYTSPAGRKAFAELEAAARAYPGGRVTYSKR